MRQLLSWVRDYGRSVADIGLRLLTCGCRPQWSRRLGVTAAALLIGGSLLWLVLHPPQAVPPLLPFKPRRNTATRIRPIPSRLPPGPHLPRLPERLASGPIDLATFAPEHDLVRVDDPRVWWESDHDSGDDEDDHLMHRSLVPPLRRLIELVNARGGRLKVHDAYRANGVHHRRSLHREGRAVDLTCTGMSLEDLARLAWAAGFDWVYYENPPGGGAHIHCSVRR